jgi:hypothetical protein
MRILLLVAAATFSTSISCTLGTEIEFFNNSGMRVSLTANYADGSLARWTIRNRDSVVLRPPATSATSWSVASSTVSWSYPSISLLLPEVPEFIGSRRFSPAFYFRVQLQPSGELFLLQPKGPAPTDALPLQPEPYPASPSASLSRGAA